MAHAHPNADPSSKPSSGAADDRLGDEDLPAAAEPPPATTATVSDDRGPVSLLGWAAIVASLLLLGMLFGAALWLYAAYAAVGMLLANRLLAQAWSRSVTAVRTAGMLEVEVGAVVPIEIEVRNTGRLPIVWMLAEDLLPRKALMYNPPALEVEGERLQVFLLPPGASRFVRYRLRCNRRGYYQIGPTVLETGDLMGLHRRYRVGATPQYLMVMPHTVALSGFDVASRRPIGEVRIRERILEDPSRLQGIRQWQPGDAMRQVHWAATARTGQLHSKIYEQTSVAGATLVIDLHRASNPARHEPVRTELAITMAASIAEALYEMNQPVGLVSNGRDAADRIRGEGWAGDFRTRAIAQQQARMKSDDDRLRPVVLPAGRGPVAFRDLQRQLARLERTDGLTLAELLIESEHRLARDTTLLLILQRCSDATAVAVLGMARRGWAVSVIINTFDQHEFSTAAGPLVAGGVAVMHLQNEEMLPSVCRQVVLR
ncbi:DUF58 domain-containing protein [Roseimaritima ulvae]|uniref:DUF58 domain-containing protein n=1 Tax=Roseimaritima ulvae TaxID=980254 RepID=A0A5B9QUU1_9BACT|nr:DUF58 domain-containing protein [Roseimaritima ulvae]QEG41739.1 hypothetical protein UC8_37650 [Roseimaritima ulvae]